MADMKQHGKGSVGELTMGGEAEAGQGEQHRSVQVGSGDLGWQWWQDCG